jgi:hypothetical protein
MAFEMKDNTGSLFKNDRKQSDTHADYGGTVKIDGREYWINAWINDKPGGGKYFGLKFKPKGDAPATSYDDKPSQAPAHADLDDDLPF